MPDEPPTPSAVFGLTAYNGEDHLAEALESLLAQTRDDFLIVVVDDCSTDRTGEIARRYVELDPRIAYERNDRQLGLVRNWRRAFDLAVERAPEAAYFAWASDHDVWHPRWLELLAAELDGHPEAALAYPQVVRIDDAGSEYPSREQHFDTGGITSPAERVRRTARDLTAAGEVVYGLARRAALERCGAFPLALLPDRLHLVRLALEGEFLQVRRHLWYRRYRTGVAMSSSRQRGASFPGGAPLWAYLPWWLPHAVLLFRSLGGRPRRLRLTGVFLGESVRHAHERRRARVQRERRWRRRERRRRYGRLARSALGGREPNAPPRAGGAAVGGEEGRSAPPLADALTALEGADLLRDLTAHGAVVLELGSGRGSGLGDALERRFPGLVHVVVHPAELDSAALGAVGLACSIGVLGDLSERALDACLATLHGLGVPVLYSLDRESAGLGAALGRRYWLRYFWLPTDGAGGRKPDPRTGPVPRPPGCFRHVVGRRRLLPETDRAEARMAP